MKKSGIILGGRIKTTYSRRILLLKKNLSWAYFVQGFFIRRFLCSKEKEEKPRRSRSDIHIERFSYLSSGRNHCGNYCRDTQENVVERCVEQAIKINAEHTAESSWKAWRFKLYFTCHFHQSLSFLDISSM